MDTLQKQVNRKTYKRFNKGHAPEILEEKKIAEQEFSKLLEDFENKKISGELLAQVLQKKAGLPKSVLTEVLDLVSLLKRI